MKAWRLEARTINARTQMRLKPKTIAGAGSWLLMGLLFKNGYCIPPALAKPEDSPLFFGQFFKNVWDKMFGSSKRDAQLRKLAG